MGLLLIFVVLGGIIGYLIGSASARSGQKWQPPPTVPKQN